MAVWPDAYYMTTNEFGAGQRRRQLRLRPRQDAARRPHAPTWSTSIGRRRHAAHRPRRRDPAPGRQPQLLLRVVQPEPRPVWPSTSSMWTLPPRPTRPSPARSCIPVANFNYPICAARAAVRAAARHDRPAGNHGDRLMYRAGLPQLRQLRVARAEPHGERHRRHSGIAAPRWYELRDPNGPPGPPSSSRAPTPRPTASTAGWAASPRTAPATSPWASAPSSSTLFPSIRYAGRLPTDPPGTFGQGEATLIAGGGSEDFPAAPRWGDYSTMSVDPVDDCTFWYTTEYFAPDRPAQLAHAHRLASSSRTARAQGTPDPRGQPPPAPCPPRPTVAAHRHPLRRQHQRHRLASPTPTRPRPGASAWATRRAAAPCPRRCAALSDTLTRHYKSYTYTNSTRQLPVRDRSMTQNCGNNAIQSVAYLGSFNPANIQTNYLADGGAGGPQLQLLLQPGRRRRPPSSWWWKSARTWAAPPIP